MKNEPTNTLHVERCAKALDAGFSTINGPRAANLLRKLAAERDGERNAREIGDRCLKDKERAMEKLFDLLKANDIDYAHLIS